MMIVLVGLLFAGHVVGLAVLVRNQRWMDWPVEKRQTTKSQKTLTVIVPARDEAADIEACLRSLLAQDHDHLTVIAINDHSSDRTGEIIDQIAEHDRRLQVIHDPELRPGWLGKHNAMQTAFDQVTSELVLLTDADVRFEPHCLSTAAAELEFCQLDLLTMSPQFEYVSFCETMLLPIYVGGATLLLSPSIQDPNSSHALAVGAFILVRTDRLKQVGGWSSLHNQILDDVGMARAFKRHGFRIGLRNAVDLMRVRLFKSNRHAFFGVTKHMMGLVQNRIWLAPVLAAIPLLMYGILLLGLFLGVRDHRPALAVCSLMTLVIHYLALIMSRPSSQFNAIKALLFPCMSIQFAAACFHAIYLHVAHGRFQWRGRDTNIRETPERD